MILALNIPAEAHKAQTYLDKLLSDGATIELKKIPKKRTLKQNAYVHALFQLWGFEYGYNIDEAKAVVKTELGYVYERSGRTFLKRTSDMDTKELTEFIDKFRTWSAHNGYYLASADEMGLNWEYYSQQIDRAEAIEKRYSY